MRVVEMPGQPASQQGGTGQAPFGAGPMGAAADPGEHQFASRLRDTLAARHASKAGHQEDERLADAEALHAATKAGSKRALSYLSGMLDDDWMMVRGYQTSGGPIGQLLIGTHGVVAMTSLQLDATVHCHGDKWHAERTGSKGAESHVEFHLADQAGRSPSTQLNQAADVLEKFLHSSGVKISVLRVVLLNHPRSRLEESRRPSVHVFTSDYDLVSWLKERPRVLDRAGRRQIERLFTSHEHHQPHVHQEPHER